MKSGSLNISGMPYRRSGHAGGKSVSMISMLVLLVAALLVLPSCFDDDDEVSCGTGTVEQNGVCVEVDTTTCGAGTEPNADGKCVVSNPLECGDGTIANADGMCVPNNAACGTGTMLNADGMCEEVDTTTLDSACGEGTTPNADSTMCVPVIVACGTGTTPNDDGECVLDTRACADGTILDPDTGKCETDFVTISTGTCEDDDSRYMGSDSPDKIMGTDKKDCIDGEKGDDSIKGLEGGDNITGGPGKDTIYGGAGNDTLDGGAGNDTLMGEANDDELIGGSGDNTLDGGDGEDIAIFLGAVQINADLDRGDALVQHVAATTGDGYLRPNTGDSGVGTDTLKNIENVKGTHGPDIINGDVNANVLKGLDGADMINGHGDNDTIIPNRPANVDSMGMKIANTAELDTVATSLDLADVVDGGMGSDTISYEGEDGDVTVNLGDPQAANDQGNSDPSDDVIAHVAVTIDNVDNITDMIKVTGTGMADDPHLSTIENVIGGFGGDTLTGDVRANTLSGGGGNDTLSGEDEPDTAAMGSDDMLYGDAGGDTLHGGPGNDTLNGGEGNDTLNGNAGNDTLIGGPYDTGGSNTYNGGAGDDTYMVIVGDTVSNSAEAADGGMDTLLYMPMADVSTTTDDESEEGVGKDASVITPSNIEAVIGTPNPDNITANGGGATIVGCGGSNVLTGGSGDDVFGVYNDGTDAVDTIVNFTTGAEDATTDEIHLKGFTGNITFGGLPGTDSRAPTHAAVLVNNVMVAAVTSATIVAIPDNPATTDVTETDWKTKVQAIIDALGKSNTDGMKVVRIVDFTPDKCVSN